jgi:hypothetical protein
MQAPEDPKQRKLGARPGPSRCFAASRAPRPTPPRPRPAAEKFKAAAKALPSSATTVFFDDGPAKPSRQDAAAAPVGGPPSPQGEPNPLASILGYRYAADDPAPHPLAARWP